jgi:uncharacterized protein
VSEYVPLDVTDALVMDAMQLAETYALRGYDAVQLGAALQVNLRSLALGLPGLTLVSADVALNTAAVVEGLTTDDPNTHHP